jgi:hypothetical protein
VPRIAGEGFARIVAERAVADNVTHVGGAGRFYINTVPGRRALGGGALHASNIIGLC